MKRLRLLLMFSVMAFITGCWDNIELEKTGFIISMAIDKYQGEEEDTNRYTLTMEMPSDEALINGFSNNANKVIKEASAETVLKAMNNIDIYSSKTAYYGHTKLIVIGEGVLKDEVLFTEVMDSLEKNKDISQKTIIVSTKERAKDIIIHENEEESLVGFFISDFYRKNKEAISYRQNLSTITISIDRNGDYIIPEIEIVDEKIEISGASIMKDNSLKTWINEEEVGQYLMMEGLNKDAILETKYNGEYIALDITKMNSKTVFSENGNTLICNIKINTDLEMEDYKLIEDGKDKEDKINEIKEQIDIEMLSNIYKFYENVIYKNEADILDLKDKLMKENYDLYLKYEDDWERTFKEMEVLVSNNINISSH